MANDDEDNARKTLSHLDDWLRDAKSVQDLVPIVVKQRETVAWQVSALDQLKDLSPGLFREVNAEMGEQYGRIRKTLRRPGYYESEIGLSTASGTTQNANSAILALISVRQGTADDIPLNLTIKAYADLQVRQERAQEVAQRLHQLFPAIETLFRSAESSFQTAKMDPYQCNNAALAMRNVLEKVQGELFQLARKHERENMTWKILGQRLGGKDSAALSEEEIAYGRLHDLLSKIQKGWPVSQSLGDLWPQFLNHLYVVCGYVLSGKGDRCTD